MKASFHYILVMTLLILCVVCFQSHAIPTHSITRPLLITSYQLGPNANERELKPTIKPDTVSPAAQFLNDNDDDSEQDHEDHGDFFAFVTLSVLIGLFVLAILWIVISTACRNRRARLLEKQRALAGDNQDGSNVDYLQLTDDKSLQIALAEQEHFQTKQQQQRQYTNGRNSTPQQVHAHQVQQSHPESLVILADGVTTPTNPKPTETSPLI